MAGISAYFSANIVSGTCFSTAIDMGRYWKTIYCQMPTISGALQFQTASTMTGTWRVLRHPPNNNTTSVQVSPTFTIMAASASGVVKILGGLRYIKVETTAAAANGTTVNIICSSE